MIQQFIPYGYSSPPTDVLMSSVDEYAGPQLDDGTQIWRITHNGVDSHPVHWHMYNVQVINRVGWDGFIRAPDPTELGWKDTVRISPLEDTIVALRPVAVTIPWPLPDKVRPIEPNMPLGALVDEPPGGFFDPLAQPVTVTNHLVNFGWEYVWHCHILAHEEMDMMHSQAVNVAPPGAAPGGLASGEVTDVATNTTAVFLAWTDNSDYESDWLIQRANLTDTLWYDLLKVPSYDTTGTGALAMAIDGTIPADTAPGYQYRVLASNVVGDDYVYANSAGFPVAMRNSTPSGADNPQAIAPPAFADFTVNATSGIAPLPVAFTDASDGSATGWDWDFGDGNFASDNGKQNPVHVYEIPGTYTASLTAMNTGGNVTSATTATITVSAAPLPAAPLARFYGSPLRGMAPLTVRFNATNSVSNPSVWGTWRWSFGDGTFSSEKNPVHTYTAGGLYTVSLSATNLGGTNTITRVGYVNVSPVHSGYSVGVFRPSNRTFILKNGTANTTVTFGLPTDIPLSGDWNGDGMFDVGVFRPATHRFILRTGTVNTFINFGNSTDFPLTGDWNGDGRWDVGFKQNGTRQYVLRNGTVNTTFLFGIRTDIPVSGDWNGDGLWDVGIRRNATFILRNGTVNTIIPYGLSTDIPITGDWNNDGRWDVGVFRLANHIFMLKNGTVNNFINFGLSTDKPITGRWS